MDEGGFRPIADFNLNDDPLLKYRQTDRGPNGGTHAPVRMQLPQRPVPLPAAPRPKPVPLVTQVPKSKKRPATYTARLKWLKRCASNKFANAKPQDSTFKTNLERRKAIQHMKLARTLANGDHKPAPVPQQQPLPTDTSLQPSITFKCIKCSSTTFENLETLKEHQLRCSSQGVSTSEPPSEAETSNNNPRAARQVVLCSACGTYFENWNLYLHMRDVHKKHICLFCLKFFSQSDKLSTHLAAKHSVQEHYYSSKDEIADKYPETFYLTCCRCELTFAQKDNYATHECSPVVKFCSACNSKGNHKLDCPKNLKKLKKNQSFAEFGSLTDKTFGENFDGIKLEPNADLNADGGLDEFANNLLNYSNNLMQYPNSMLYPNNLNLTYPSPEVKSEKISPNALAQLIEEVKNCISTPNQPQQQPPQIDASKNQDIKSPKSEHSIAADNQTNESQPKALENNRQQTPVHNVNNSYKSLSESSNNSLTLKDAKVEDIKEPVSYNKVPKLTVKVPKVTSEKESSDYSSGSEDSDKLTVDLGANTNEQPNYPNHKEDLNKSVDLEVKKPEVIPESEPPAPAEDIPIIELMLDQPLDRYPLKDLLKVLLNASVFSCIYCNHARKIAVNGKQLGLHFISQHKFTATVNSITAEELLPETIISKIKSCLDDVESEYVNLIGYNKESADVNLYDQTYECFQCYYVTRMHKDLYFHNRKMHQKTILLCIMCKTNFYTYSELICHLCPGMYITSNELLFKCCLCCSDTIPSAFRLMVHLRKRHLACDVCLETCSNQSKLSIHVWKHKLHHLCYRCGIAYRNKPDIKKHLFWKHGTESVLCKKCLQKKWPHVYHFCIPPTSFACDECNLNFSKAVYLKVHKRSHVAEYPHECKEEGCTGKFISKNLLKKHQKVHTDAVALAESEKQKQIDAMDKVIDITDTPDEKDVNNDASGVAQSATKSKKSKKSRIKDNLLMDVNLPELNLSESGSSDDSEAEIVEQDKDNDESKKEIINLVDEQPQQKLDSIEEAKSEPVIGIWDNFKLYQESLEKNVEKPHVPKHVCDSDHDYCVIPTSDSPDVEIVGEIKPKTSTIVDHLAKDSPKKKKNVKKKKTDGMSSSSDSSSDSDTTCSGGSNCSCCSSSGSSSSSSSSDSSLGSRRKNNQRKDSENSHNSAVDIMATGDSPTHIPSKSAEFSIAETDLDTDESATDEEFYDKHPEKIASKLLAEKRNQLMQLASTSPLNNGSYVEPSNLINSQDEPLDNNKPMKKKVKIKKKKKDKRESQDSSALVCTDSINIPHLEHHQQQQQQLQINAPNKITISLQSNKVQMNDMSSITTAPELTKTNLAAMLDESKRASKRRRVPNKFYGYSSDEEYMIKPQIPQINKMDWSKEEIQSPAQLPMQMTEAPDLPAMQPMQLPPIILPPRVPEVINQMCPEPIMVIPPKPVSVHKDDESSDDSDSSKEGNLQIKDPYSPMAISEPESNIVKPAEAAAQPLPSVLDNSIPFPRPAGAREAREGESVYCYCRCPYDEVSEMIACDADGCAIEWFHFECVGIMVPPKGKWFCPDCRLKVDYIHK